MVQPFQGWCHNKVLGLAQTIGDSCWRTIAEKTTASHSSALHRIAYYRIVSRKYNPCDARHNGNDYLLRARRISSATHISHAGSISGERPLLPRRLRDDAPHADKPARLLACLLIAAR